MVLQQIKKKTALSRKFSIEYLIKPDKTAISILGLLQSSWLDCLCLLLRVFSVGLNESEF